MFASCDSSGGSSGDSDEIPDATTVTNGDFETGDYEGWTVSIGDDASGWGTWDVETNSSSENNKTNYLNLYNGKGTTLNTTATQTLTLYAGSYTASIQVSGVTGSSELVFSAAIAEDEADADADEE